MGACSQGSDGSPCNAPLWPQQDPCGPTIHAPDRTAPSLVDVCVDRTALNASRIECWGLLHRACPSTSLGHAVIGPSHRRYRTEAWETWHGRSSCTGYGNLLVPFSMSWEPCDSPHGLSTHCMRWQHCLQHVLPAAGRCYGMSARTLYCPVAGHSCEG